MNDWLENDRDRPDDIGSDPILREALQALDPATGDPGYWLRFRGWVMSGAAAELAQRRLMAELTVSDVLTSWARTLVPTAALAAALAGIMLLRGGDPAAERLVGVDELLVSEVTVESAQVLLSPEVATGVVAFASVEAY